MDFSSFEKDLEELKADPKVREALEKGVELTNYAAEIERELDKLVNDSIPDYVREAPETEALNAEIEACDTVLESIENILHEFQRELGGISEEIRFLQEESLSMGVKLRNRRELETRIRCFLERITVPEDLVKDICDKEVTQEYSQMTLRKLDEYMTFCRERTTGLVLLKGKGVPSSPKAGSPRVDTGSDIRLSIAPCETSAVQDVEPQLDKLRLRAIAKVRAFFLERISQLKKPSTNVQIMQQDLVRFRYAAEFLQRHAPNVAEEVRSTYVDVMKTILVSLFKTYHTQLMKLVPPPTNGPSALAVGLGAQANAQQAELIAADKRRPDPMPLAQREAETGTPDAPPIVIHLAQSKKIPYEATFRSEQKHLIDSSTSEYLFLLDFFGSAAASTSGFGGDSAVKRARQTAEALFESVFGKTIQALMDQLDAYLSTATDAVSLLLMIKIAQAHRHIMRRRKVLVLESYFDTLDQKLWPQLKRIIDANIKSMMTTDPRKLMGPKLDTTAHFWTRKYALFATSVYAVASELGENSDGSIPRALEIARNKAVELMERMAALLPSPKSRAVFMINNCDSILGTFGEVGRVQPADAQRFEDVLALNKSLFVDEELQEYFGRMIRFVKQADQDPAKVSDAEAKELVIDFATNWRSGADLISASIATHFPSFALGKEILGMCLAQLVIDYQRFREIVQDRPTVKGSKSARLVEMSVLLAEVERYSKGV